MRHVAENRRFCFLLTCVSIFSPFSCPLNHIVTTVLKHSLKIEVIYSLNKAFLDIWSAIAILWLSCIHFCVFALKGDGEPAGQSQGEPKTADPAGRYGAGAVQETGGAQL